MYTINHKYKNTKLLNEWLIEYDFASKKECMIQFFCGIAKKNKMEEISTLLCKNLPNAHIIGTTTDGEINKDKVTDHEIIISVSIFEKSTISSVGVEYENDSYKLGHDIATELNSDDIKVMILFTTGLVINGESVMNGVRAISHGKYFIAGGMAGDNANFKQTYISHKNNIISKGAVGIVLKGDELNIRHDYILGWDAVGLPMRVTKSIKNRVYELDGIKIVDIYQKYFGQEIALSLPEVGVEIPLIIKRNGNKIARACINKFEDGSLLFAGNVNEGEEVRFGIGNVDTILKETQEQCERFDNGCNPETIFIYSCMARRRLLKARSNLEFKDMAQKCNISGFFTNGEFFGDEFNNYLFNESMTILALSESDFITPKQVVEHNKHKKQKDNDNKMMHALTHMTNVIAKEWQERVDAEIQKNKEQERQSFQKNKLAQMGEMIGMIAHQWRQPLNAISATGINISLLSSMEMLEDKKVQESSEFIQEQCQNMSATIDTFMNFVKPSKESKVFNIGHSIDSIMQIMGTQLSNHSINVKVTTEDKEMSIEGHEDLLEQVLINILSNARDAFEDINKDDKYIKIKVGRKEKKVQIMIMDNAGGIPEDIREKIFNPYFTTKEQGKGTGIGLYMSMDIMKKSFGGNLKYEATNDGSCFIVIASDIVKNV